MAVCADCERWKRIAREFERLFVDALVALEACPQMQATFEDLQDQYDEIEPPAPTDGKEG